METNIYYVVQSWDDRYQFWGNTSEPSDRMFGLPVTSYETDTAGRQRLDALQAASPSAKYRLIRVTETREVV